MARNDGRYNFGKKTNKKRNAVILVLFCVIITGMFYFEIPIPYLEDGSLSGYRNIKENYVGFVITQIKDNEIYQNIASTLYNIPYHETGINY